MRDSQSERKIKKDLNDFINRQDELHYNVQLNEEFDFQALKEYVEKKLFSKDRLGLYSFDLNERKKARESFIDGAVYYVNADNPQAQTAVREIIYNCFKIIDRFYSENASNEAYFIVSNIEDSVDEIVSEQADRVINELSVSTNRLMQAIDQKPVQPSVNKDDIVSFSDVTKEYQYSLKNINNVIFDDIKQCFGFIWSVIESFQIESLKTNNRAVMESAVMGCILRYALFNNVSVSFDCDEDIMHLSQTDNLNMLVDDANELFFSREKDKNIIAVSTFTLFFTDLYIALSKNPHIYEDAIRYKCNADVCKALSDFCKHISFQHVPIKIDNTRRSMTICLTCDEPNAHKAAALIVNEYERCLGGLEAIFEFLGIHLYYVRAKINSYGNDNTDNFNFEAYTPTLMPLLSGGHLYSTKYVFIRELVQNCIDSISVRRLLEDSDDPETTIRITLALEEGTEYIRELSIEDNGMGMSKIEIERYLTSIGRSYYTANDYRKMNLPYRPISSFGIGFLSCFLTCNEVSIRTHSKNDGNIYLLTIPNIEGCFFIEQSDEKMDEGTIVCMVMNKDSKISMYELLEYAVRHFLDIPYRLSIKLEKLYLSEMKVVGKVVRNLKITNTDISDFSRHQVQPAPCEYAFCEDSVIIPYADVRMFKHDWWNKYIRNQCEAELETGKNGFKDITIPPHSIRKAGDSFFLFIAFDGDDIIFCNAERIEDTFKNTYGIFITDLPYAGYKMRSKENGMRPYSGTLQILNAGILVDEATLASLFGESMRIYDNDQETAYNNVVMSFPPDWIELSISREKVMSLSKSVDQEKLLRGIASATVDALNTFLTEKRRIPIINIQEIANFITIICSNLNSLCLEDGKKLFTELKKKKFLLKAIADEKGIRFVMDEDNGDNMNMQLWFEANYDLCCRHREFDGLPDQFFNDFERIMSKKRIYDINEINQDLLENYGIKKNCNAELALIMLATYLFYFPQHRIAKYSTKAGKARLVVERMMMRECTLTDYANNKLNWVITYPSINEIAGSVIDKQASKRL